MAEWKIKGQSTAKFEKEESSRKNDRKDDWQKGGGDFTKDESTSVFSKKFGANRGAKFSDRVNRDNSDSDNPFEWTKDILSDSVTSVDLTDGDLRAAISAIVPLFGEVAKNCNEDQYDSLVAVMTALGVKSEFIQETQAHAPLSLDQETLDKSLIELKNYLEGSGNLRSSSTSKFIQICETRRLQKKPQTTEVFKMILELYDNGLIKDDIKTNSSKANLLILLNKALEWKNKSNDSSYSSSGGGSSFKSSSGVEWKINAGSSSFRSNRGRSSDTAEDNTWSRRGSSNDSGRSNNRRELVKVSI